MYNHVIFVNVDVLSHSKSFVFFIARGVLLLAGAKTPCIRDSSSSGFFVAQFIKHYNGL